MKAATADPASMMKRISPYCLNQFVLCGPAGRFRSARPVVAKGHCIHIPTGVRRTVGSVWRRRCRIRCRRQLSPPLNLASAAFGMAVETVMLPEQGIECLRAAGGWLLPADGVAVPPPRW